MNGWYKHGKHASKPTPGRRAAKIRAYVEKALKVYKRPGNQASSSWMNATKQQRGRGVAGSVLRKQILFGIGKLGKNVLKQAFLGSAVPTYRMLTSKGESLLRNYVQSRRKQRGKGIYLPMTAQVLARAQRTKHKGGVFPLLAAALPTVLTTLGTGALSRAAGFGVKKLLDKVTR